jgi:hypothetical protein
VGRLVASASRVRAPGGRVRGAPASRPAAPEAAAGVHGGHRVRVRGDHDRPPVHSGDAALGGGCAAGDGVLQRARRRKRVRPGKRTDVPAARPRGRRRPRRRTTGPFQKRKRRSFASRRLRNAQKRTKTARRRRRTPRASPRVGSAPRSSRWWARTTTRFARRKERSEPKKKPTEPTTRP